MRVEEEMFEKVFGQSVEETLRETREEGVAARARKAEAVPSKEVEDHNLDYAVFRNWCPHCMKRRAEAYGHRNRGGETGDVPAVHLDHVCARSEQEKEEEECRLLG